MRVALLTNVLTPYRLPVYRDLANTPGLDLRMLLSARTEAQWREMFAGAYEQGRHELAVEVTAGVSLRHRVATHRGSRTSDEVEMHLPLGTLATLHRVRPDVIVSAELGLRSVLAAAYAAATRTPLVLWSYMSRSAHAAAPPRSRLRRRLLLGRADAVVGMGVQAREVLRDLGVPPERLFDAPNAHDAGSYERALAGIDPVAARAALRARLRLRERVALVVGRLAPVKGTRPLLDAWARVPEDVRGGASLLFIGDGPEAASVRSAAERRPGEIAWVPSVSPESMPELYAAADLLVFPSLGEPWGLVVNEALACGLPVLCSSLAGCADDLALPDVTGWRFDPTEPAELTGALDRALRSDSLARMGECGRDLAKRFAPEQMAAGLRRAIAYAAARRRSAVR